jgi:hypothetical protein
MPRPRKPPVILTPEQKTQSLLKRAENLRAIAATSRDPSVRKTLIERAEEWEKRAREPDGETTTPTAEFSEPA